jgi:hypothetical protein
MVAVIGEKVGFAAVNAGTEFGPVPLAARPIAGLLFVQVKVVPATGPVKLVAGAEAPLQYTWFAIGLTVTVGFTVTVYEEVVPAHPLAVGVTVMVAVIGEKVGFAAVNAGTELGPAPLAARPIAGLLFVQLKAVPATGPVKFVAGTETPLQ